MADDDTARTSDSIAATANPSEPIISHPTSPAPPTDGISTVSEPVKPSIPTPAPLTKSMFDFVSPFDIFDKPKSTPPPGASTKIASPSSASVPGSTSTAQDAEQDIKPIIDSKGDAIPGKASMGSSQGATRLGSTKISTPGKTATPPPAGSPSNQSRNRQTSAVAPSNGSGAVKGDLGLVWQVGKVVERGIEGQG